MPRRKETTETIWHQRRRKAEECLWHLAPPWNSQFIHDHWWTNKRQQVTPPAAIWELLRRHPRSEELISGSYQGTYSILPEYVLSISLWGKKSWNRLEERQQKKWVEEAKEISPQHGIGVGLSSDVEVLQGLEGSEISRLGRKFWKTFGFYNLDVESLKKAHKLWRANSANFDEYYCDPVFMHFSQGSVIIAFNPNVRGIERRLHLTVRQILRKQNKTSLTTVGRSFPKRWLEIISRFEIEEIRRPRNVKRNKDRFTDYRRLLQSWQVPW